MHREDLSKIRNLDHFNEIFQPKYVLYGFLEKFLRQIDHLNIQKLPLETLKSLNINDFNAVLLINVSPEEYLNAVSVVFGDQQD
ncbi:hypothetical protein A142_21300 [Vibrio splendidus 12E03]|uniref:Uncharacterized protein n=1 Tax=Vibrio splendidus 12E03 TaxID=1191305 RepID=A0A1E5FS82_VIBSP|nr:hypothetical protein A142_21300 [Vibrio splendidus 12E03]